MPRIAKPLHCEPDILRELECLSRSRTTEARIVERVQIVLACLSGKRNDE
ncbi:MAG: IS630 family transposase, partial [Geobacteraceae bacterium]|nr:IS630 family transposase [Geobacteraceae bacterium]